MDNKQKKVLAVNDISCVGRCSLTVALPIISAAGIETSILPTAVLSTHTGGFEGFTYRDLTADIDPIVAHWKSLGLSFNGICSGFLGSAEQADKIAVLFDTFKTSDNIVMVDPVMADNGELYAIFDHRMVEGMRKLSAKADVVVPNLTEASLLLGCEYIAGGYDEAYIEDMLKKLTQLGPRYAVLTGVSFEKGKLGAAAYDSVSGKVSYSFAPEIEGYFHGTGDVFASALIAAVICGKAISDACAVAVEYTQKCIAMTAEQKLEARYGVCFEQATAFLLEKLGIR